MDASPPNPWIAPTDRVLSHCGSLSAGEAVVVVCDAATASVAEIFAERARVMGGLVELQTVPAAAVHGEEPPAEIARAMAGADLIVGLTKMSMAHTRARGEAAAKGARYLSLPEYSLALLEHPALEADFRGRAPLVQAVADAFTEGTTVRVTAPAGTDVTLDITGRTGNCCPGFVDAPGALGSPPDIEANVSPVETASSGIVVVDGSIPCPEAGLLRDPVTLRVAAGRITKIEGADRALVGRVRALFERIGTPKAYVLAECGVGLNDRATLTGTMLTDEGAAGCMHFGFGANATVGGTNDVPFHLDFVFRDASLFIDGRPVIQDGEVVL